MTAKPAPKHVPKALPKAQPKEQPKDQPKDQPREPPIPMETLPGLPEMPTAVRPKADGEVHHAPAEWALVAYAGTALGRVFPLTAGQVMVGRAPEAGVTLMDGEVSRNHARLLVEESRVQVEDLESTNGTRVNGEVLHGRRDLHTGDRISIGGHVLKLVFLDSLERAFHETLLDLSTKDPLTGLANRGSILGELQNRFGLSLRYGRPISVVVCDLDHFKKVNDTYGHGAGDFVLHAFGERLMATLREADLAGRIGGEEFLMILPETDLAGARPFAERLRKAIAATPVSMPLGGLTITCSLGIAERTAADLEAGQLLARADAALYKAKDAGRNQVSEG